MKHFTGYWGCETLRLWDLTPALSVDCGLFTPFFARAARQHGIITNIDSILYKAYIRDAYEDTIFYYDLCKYTGKDVLLVGTQVTYYKLYYKTPVAVGLLTKKETCNAELFKSDDKKRY